jgi:hypothetical protein
VSESAASSAEPRAEERASHAAFLRHPLFVGAAVAVIGAVFASLLIPSITQVTQDRPKELELKRSIVEGIAAATASALNRGVALGRGDLRAAGGKPGEEKLTVYRRVYGDWLIAESTIDAQVATYFSQGGADSRDAWENWRAMRTGVMHFLRLTAVDQPRVRVAARAYLKQRLRPFMTTEQDVQKFQGLFAKPSTLLNQAKLKNVIRGLAELMELDRDAVTLKLVGAPATGFRHSPWSL